jgi:hypothetical protein
MFRHSGTKLGTGKRSMRRHGVFGAVQIMVGGGVGGLANIAYDIKWEV